MNTDERTLAQARDDWQAALGRTDPDYTGTALEPPLDFAKCPCCERKGRIYSRRISAAMAKSLLWLVDKSFTKEPGSFIAVSARAGATDAAVDARGWTTLEAFQLVDRPPIVPDGGRHMRQRRQGLWRPTPRGVAFACGEVNLPTYAIVYENDGVLRYEGKDIWIEDALRAGPFSLSELLRTNYANVDERFMWPEGYVEELEDGE